MPTKFDIVLDRLDDICERFELEGSHTHPTYKQFKSLFAELESLRDESDWDAVMTALENQNVDLRENLKWFEAGAKAEADAGDEARTELAELKAAQAPVVLPERLPMQPYQTVDRGSTNYKAGYNAAIREAERLNNLS